MSRSFKENVREEIYRRESVRQDRRLKKYRKMLENIVTENPEKLLMTNFKRELESCYRTSNDFEGFSSDSAYIFSKEVKIAEKMGFKVEHNDGEIYCKFTVPPFKKGNRRTPAQLMLYKYERALAKKRKERKKQLLSECKRVKKAISEGKFRDEESINTWEIYVYSKEHVAWGYEEKVVCKFFNKLNLSFKCSRVGIKDEWIFTI